MAMRKTLATVVALATIGLAGCQPCDLSFDGPLEKEYVVFRCIPQFFQPSDYLLNVKGEDGYVREYFDRGGDGVLDSYIVLRDGISCSFESGEQFDQGKREYHNYVKAILFEKVTQGLLRLQSDGL